MTVKIDKGSALSSLSMTPLIDVIFLLLIFFLVATKFAEEERDLQLQLPEASEAMPLISQPKAIMINIVSDGRYYVGGQETSLAELGPILDRARIDNPTSATALIRADENCPFGRVAAAVNACQKADVKYDTCALPAEADITAPN
jgi:biopolymer transport protein ExbD